MNEIIRTPAAKAFLKQMSDDKKPVQIVECVLIEDIVLDDADPNDWAHEYCEGCDDAVMWPMSAPNIPADHPNRVAALCRDCYREFLTMASETGAKAQELEVPTGTLRFRLNVTTVDVPS